VNEARLPRDIVVVGGSAGSLTVVFTILQRLPRNLPALLAIVMHRSPTYNGQLVQLLGRRSHLPVSEPTHGDPLALGQVYVAPPDHHMRVDGDAWNVARGAKVHWARPAIDPLFLSAASTFGSRVVGIQLSGGGSDGVSGLISIHAHGGLTMAQRPDEAQSPSMPSTAILKDDIDAVLSADEIAAAIPGLVIGNAISTLR
jgi:two-component system, chemotaxis family, protein-glutamate methylesterase/glutaminase